MCSIPFFPSHCPLPFNLPWFREIKLRSQGPMCSSCCLAAIFSLALHRAGTRPWWHRASMLWDCLANVKNLTSQLLNRTNFCIYSVLWYSTYLYFFEVGCAFFKKGLIFDSSHHTVITILDRRKISELPYQVRHISCSIILVLWWHQEVWDLPD